MSSKAHRVLLVDDNDDVLALSGDMLEELGYVVARASSAAEALVQLERDPNLDVMVSDVRMPGMSGLELYELVRALYAGVKIILMSGYSTPQAMPCPLVQKPFRTDDLDQAIRTALSG